MKSDYCILYSDIRQNLEYVARSERPLTQVEWQSVIDRAAERWRQIDNFLGKGRSLPIKLQEEELEAYENGVVGMFRWMFPEFSVSRKPVFRVCYDAYSTAYKKPG